MANGNQRLAPRGRLRADGRRTLSREQVVEEALELVDEEGVSALSMRKLAERLGVEAMSLYTHVANKDVLLDAIADRVARDLILPPTGVESWQTRIRNAVRAWARMEELHPGAFPLIYRSRSGTPAEYAVNEEIMSALEAAGFDPANVALAYQTLIAFLDGALLNWPRSRWSASTAWGEASTAVDADLYPLINRTARYASRLTWEEVFFFGLDLFLAGLQDRLSHSEVQ